MILELGGCCSHWTVLYDVKPRTMLLLDSGYLRTLTRSHCTLGPSKTHYRLKLPAAIAISRVRPTYMLIEIDRSIGEFDRALIGSAIDFRGAFRSRAGGFGFAALPAAMVSTIATAIASMIATAATATAAKMGVMAFVASRRQPMRRADNQCENAPISVKVPMYTETTPDCFSNGQSFSRSFLPVSTLLAALVEVAIATTLKLEHAEQIVDGWAICRNIGISLHRERIGEVIPAPPGDRGQMPVSLDEFPGSRRGRSNNAPHGRLLNKAIRQSVECAFRPRRNRVPEYTPNRNSRGACSLYFSMCRHGLCCNGSKDPRG